MGKKINSFQEKAVRLGNYHDANKCLVLSTAAMSLNPNTGRQGQTDLHEFQASLVCTESSRLAWATQRDANKQNMMCLVIPSVFVK